MTSEARRLLILCVDRDNDVGERLGVPTPVIGRDNLLRIAVEYILRYPDDSDANALFGAIQLYDTLAMTMGRENVEVALVTGSSMGDVAADMKVLKEVDEVLSIFNADAFIIVSDGPSDEAVIPLLQSRRPVVSVKRIVVKQSKGIEEFAVLAKYYMSKLLTEPRYRRFILGLPGLILLLYGLFQFIWPYIPPSAKSTIISSIPLGIGLFLLSYGIGLHEVFLRLLRTYEFTTFVTAFATFSIVTYVLIQMYVFEQGLIEGFPNIFTVSAIALGSSLLVNVVESYVKFREFPFGRAAACILLPLFTGLVLDASVKYLLGLVGIDHLVIALLAYLVIGMTTLIVIGKARRR